MNSFEETNFAVAFTRLLAG